MDYKEYAARDEKINDLLEAKRVGLAEETDEKVDADPRVIESLQLVHAMRHDGSELMGKHRDLLEQVKRELVRAAGIDLDIMFANQD